MYYLLCIICYIVIYLLTCKNCVLPIVGETALALNKHRNIRRTSEKGCQHIVSYFKECCQKSYFYSSD